MKKYIRQIKFEILFQIIFAILESAALAALAYLPKLIFDLVTKDSQQATKSVLMLMMAYVCISLLAVGASYLEMLFTWRYAIAFENSIKDDYFSAIIQYDDAAFHQKDISEYVSIQSNDIMQIEQDYLTPIVSAINQIIKILVFGIVMFIGIDWRIGLVVMSTSLLAALLPRYTGQKTASKRLIFVEKLGAYTNLIYDLFSGFREITPRTAKNIINENKKALHQTKTSRYDYGKNKSISLAINRLSRTAVQLLGFSMATWLLYRGDISIGTCIATLGFISSFVDPLEEILYCFTTIETVKDVKNKVFNLLNQPPTQAKIIQKDFAQKLELRQVSLTNGNFSLKDISFTFEKNKHYGLIGHNGCGKSTLLNTLMGYLPQSSGDIFLDGQPLSQYQKEWLITYLVQRSHVFSTDYYNNITLFDSYRDTSEQLLCQIGLSETLIKRLKTQNNSQQLSGGEKQILAYLRARNADTPILLMDEPFSAVDQDTKQKLMKDISTLKDKTVIMITHDLDESLAYFDQVIQLNEGQLKLYV